MHCNGPRHKRVKLGGSDLPKSRQTYRHPLICLYGLLFPVIYFTEMKFMGHCSQFFESKLKEEPVQGK